MHLLHAAWAAFLLAFPAVSLAQGWGGVTGRVTEIPDGLPVPGVTVLVDGTNFGTATDGEGQYELRIPEGHYALRFSAVGYAPRLDSVTVRRGRTTTFDVALRTAVIALEGLTVEDSATPTEAGVYEITPEMVQNIPAPFKDGFRALKVLPGVATNNELSNEYSVRGGGFNENLVFINGFEVYKPFRARQGEQEGLGVLNPELTERLTFYTGGFPARYGGKLSSALDVQYRRPDGEPLTGAASLSLLDASMAAGASALDGRLGWTLGLRKARASHFFATQELKGVYQPDYTDLQGTLAYRLAPGHEVEALGIWADYDFRLEPSNRRTYFGIVSADAQRPSDLQSVATDYVGGERDGYATRFGGVRLSNRLSERLRVEHDLSYFQTVEHEAFAIKGAARLTQVDPFSGAEFPLGEARQEDAADNRISVSTWTGQGRGMLTFSRHALEGGWHARRLHFNDRIQEKSAVSRDTPGGVERLVADSLQDQASFGSAQAGLYLQDAYDVLPQQRNRLVVTGGLRTDYFAFNDEWTVSPRLSARFLLSSTTTLVGAWGVYYQTPTYRELRGKPVPGETILGTLNRSLKAQRSVQVVGGVEQFFPKSRLYLRAEAYYKDLDNLISYDIENVRVLYSGENDARGRAYGLDVQLRGEFVPGLESWVNYSYLSAREAFLSAFQDRYNQGLIPRPTDQRHTFSLFVQDYIPNDETWKIHLRALFGSGFPYTPLVPGPRVGNVVFQVPGPRFGARYPEYRRVDLGATKYILLSESGLHRPLRLELTAEILNLFDMTNTVAYTWIPGSDGLWRRVPTRLTPRTFNVRLRLEF